MSDEKRMCETIILTKLISEKYQNEITKIIYKFGLNFGEANTLLFFYDNPDCINAKDFRNNHHVSKAYVSKAINSLLDKKLVNIVVDNNDKRYQKIEINENALKILNALNEVRKEVRNSLMKNITEEELSTFFEVLRKIKENIINIEEGK